MFLSANPYRDADRWIDMQEAMLEKLPKCDFCGEPIQDEYLWEIGGEVYCERCAADTFRKSNDAV